MKGYDLLYCLCDSIMFVDPEGVCPFLEGNNVVASLLGVVE
jgi:hypothetical protein